MSDFGFRCPHCSLWFEPPANGQELRGLWEHVAECAQADVESRRSAGEMLECEDWEFELMHQMLGHLFARAPRAIQ